MSDPVTKLAPTPELDDAQRFRSQVGHISRNSAVYFAGTIFSVGLGYIFKVYLARVLGADGLGIYALGITLIGFLGAFNSLGLVESAVRYASVYRAAHKPEQLGALLWSGGATILFANLVSVFALLAGGRFVAIRFYHAPALGQYIPWFAVLMLLGSVSTFYGRILAGYKQVGRRTVITNFIGSPTTMLFSVILISVGWGLRGYLLAQTLGAILVSTLILGFVWKLTPQESRITSSWPRRMEREVWAFSAAAVGVLFLEFLIGQTDKIALGFFLGTRQVGIYSVAAALVAYISLILNSVNQVFSPIIADLHTRHDFVLLGRLYKALTKWILGFTLPLALTVMICAIPILRIFGPDFVNGWPILIVGAIGQLINCGVGSVGLLLLMSGHQNRLLRVQAVMAAVMTCGSVALVPIWGITGAAVAAAVTNAGTNAWNLLEVRRALGLSPFSRSYLRLLVPTIISVSAAILIKFESRLLRHDWLVIGLTLGASYLAFAGGVAMMGLDDDDRLVVNALKSRLRRDAPMMERSEIA